MLLLWVHSVKLPSQSWVG